MADSNITKNALAAALKRLMKSRGFEKISVSEICEECGMNRKSFYYHFKDKFDLVNWIFYDEFLAGLQVATYENGWDAMKDLCRRFYEDRDFYLAALKIEGQNSFRDYVADTIGPLVTYFTEDLFERDTERDFFYTFFTDALLHSIMRWLDGYMTLSPEAFVDNIQNVFVDIAANTPARDDREERSLP